MQPKYDIVVTRHPHLVTVLRERGLVTETTIVLTHVDDAEQVRGLHVIGVLPHHLSARAASITEIPMRWSEEDRKAMQHGDIGLGETRAAAGDPVTYVVTEDREPIEGPLTGSNLTGMDDLAAAAYMVQATAAIAWDDLTQGQRNRWITVICYLVDILAPREWCDGGPEITALLTRARLDGIGARRVAEAGLGQAIAHEVALSEIRQRK